jgi:hypothetical protein
MSQLERLAEEKKSRRVARRPAKANGKNSGFVAFHPTKEEREEIKADQTPLREVIDFLFTWVEDGHKLTFGYKPENEAYYLALREGGASFDEAVTLSMWHADPWMCVYGMKAALKGRYASFPAIQLDFNDSLNW